MEKTASLMGRAVHGDRAAYGEIYRRYADVIRRVAYLLLHHSAAAEDVVQETFASALEKLHQFRGEGEVRSWFYSIALNHCRRRIRSAAGEGAATAGRTRRVALEPRGVLTSLARRETARQVAVGLGFLTEAQREAFVLHYVEELPYVEVAQLLGVSADAARALSHRARVVLRERLPALGL